MNNESRTLWISLGCGLLAAFLLYSYSQEKKAEYDSQYGTTTSVVIAKVDISEMRTIDDTMLEVSQRPSNFLEPSAVKDPEVAVGQVAAVPIKKGEQILTTKLLHPGPDTGIALQVAPEKRAITLPVDDIRGVAKLIRPGDRVDLYAAFEVGKGLNVRREVSVMMVDVVILATGLNIMNSIPRMFEVDANGKDVSMINLANDTKYTTVTIEATPKEAQDLIYLMATNPGNIYFALRNPNDRKPPTRVPSSNADSVLARVGIAPDSAQIQQVQQFNQVVPQAPGRAPTNR
jgi:pilus assembly protein CpaB